MATRTQVQIEVLTGCIHERLLQAVYDQQRRRIRGLCQWMAADAQAAEHLTMHVFVEAWAARKETDETGERAGERARERAGESWMRASGESLDECLIASFARHFRGLFHADAPPAAGAAGRAGAARRVDAGSLPRMARSGGDARRAGHAAPGACELPPAGLRGAVSALPPRERLLYLLHELEGHTPETLGAWLELEPSYCARMIHQARLQLCRTMFDSQGTA